MQKILTYENLLNSNQIIVESILKDFENYGYEDGIVLNDLLIKLKQKIDSLESIISTKYPNKINLDKTKLFKDIIADYEKILGVYQLTNFDQYLSKYKDILNEAPNKINYFFVTTYKDIKIYLNDSGSEPHLHKRISRVGHYIDNDILLLRIKLLIDYLYNNPTKNPMINWTSKYLNGWWNFTITCYKSDIKFCASLEQLTKNLYISTFLNKKQIAHSSDTQLSLPF